MSLTALDYRDQMIALLPTGPAWPREADSQLGRLLYGLADEFARIDGRCEALIEEADPRTALELLPDWERVAGLPDGCVAAPATVSERQIALRNRLVQRGGQSIIWFESLALRLGYFIDIEELRPFSCGDALDAGLLGEWAHVWRVVAQLEAGSAAGGRVVADVNATCEDRLAMWGAVDLECVIRRAAPAHTIVLFAYREEPAATFWFDFLNEGYNA